MTKFIIMVFFQCLELSNKLLPTVDAHKANDHKTTLRGNIIVDKRWNGNIREATEKAL